MSRLLHLDRTLDELEGAPWPDPPPDSTALVKNVHALRKKELAALTVEDLRTLTLQNVGLPFVLPLALQVLRRDPLAEGRYYEGDLLSAVLRQPAEAWKVFPDLAEELADIVSSLSGTTSGTADHLDRDIRDFLARRPAS
ncbi:contact-dependent growth inhibition system immunity protein [Streptomyces sp. 3N207]|uniref:contact-dependent growth inhibition system immunity protein n=1 Tax=Streptomyces sp. 3N207 TaxID=3457417 RepID=UPI003FD697F0